MYIGNFCFLMDKKMRKVLFLIMLIVSVSELFAQTPIQVIWRNGGKDGDIVTLKDAQDGVDLKQAVSKQRSIYSENTTFGAVSIECSFSKRDILNYPNGEVEFDVKWYYYMSTKKSLMGSNSIIVDASNDSDGIVKLVCTKPNVRSGWWEVVVKNKETGEIIQYANQQNFQIKFN